jgi:hypothetical protein
MGVVVGCFLLFVRAGRGSSGYTVYAAATAFATLHVDRGISIVVFLTKHYIRWRILKRPLLKTLLTDEKPKLT